MAETRAAQAVISAAEADARAEAADWSATLDKKNLVEAEARATAANVRATAAETRVTAVETRAADADARAEAAEKKLEEYTKRATEVVTKLAEANKTIAVYKKRATEVETKHAAVDQQQSNDSYLASRGTAQDEADAEKEQLRYVPCEKCPHCSLNCRNCKICKARRMQIRSISADKLRTRGVEMRDFVLKNLRSSVSEDQIKDYEQF